MPTYEYACKSCGEHIEVVQSFSDDPLTDCPSCGGPLRKVFGTPGIVLKGSGFYKTDSRTSNGKSGGASAKDAPKESSGSESSSGTSTEGGAKPAGDNSSAAGGSSSGSKSSDAAVGAKS